MQTNPYAELAELAGGFIHEIKNHLSTLGLNLQLLTEDFQDPQSQRERRALTRVQRLQTECQRLVDVSNDFLRFARIKDLERSPTDLAKLIEEMLDFFGPTAKVANIEIKVYLHADLPPVSLDRELFKQAILNLMLNAEQAMPRGGELTIEATVEEPSGFVCLSLIDTGQGINPEVLDKIFQPFFSTKQNGSGLGLPTTRKIVEAHGGQIEVQSDIGHGTKFCLRLPPCDPLPIPSLPGAHRERTMSLPDYLACYDGEVMPLSQVKISPLDRAYLFGDAIYEVLRIYGGKAFVAEEHFKRLANSLATIRITGVVLDRTYRRMIDLLARANCPEAMFYIQISRGIAPRKHAFPKNTPPVELMWVIPYDDGPTAEKRKTGVNVITHPDLRWKRCDVKSVNLLGNVLANQAAAEADCDEVLLYTEDGYLTEASHSSFFGVRDGALITTPGGNTILPGITRIVTFRLAPKAGIPVREEKLRREDLNKIDELFLTGTTSEVLPIARVDGQPIRDGVPGPITRKLQREFSDAVKQFLA